MLRLYLYVYASAREIIMDKLQAKWLKLKVHVLSSTSTSTLLLISVPYVEVSLTLININLVNRIVILFCSRSSHFVFVVVVV